VLIKQDTYIKGVCCCWRASQWPGCRRRPVRQWGPWTPSAKKAPMQHGRLHLGELFSPSMLQQHLLPALFSSSGAPSFLYSIKAFHRITTTPRRPGPCTPLTRSGTCSSSAPTTTSRRAPTRMEERDGTWPDTSSSQREMLLSLIIKLATVHATWFECFPIIQILSAVIQLLVTY
jgi:hypothetical protein